MANQLARCGLCGSTAEPAEEIRCPYLDAEGKLKEVGGGVLICVGKYRGRRVREVAAQDRSYLAWMMREMGPFLGAPAPAKSGRPA